MVVLLVSCFLSRFILDYSVVFAPFLNKTLVRRDPRPMKRTTAREPSNFALFRHEDLQIALLWFCLKAEYPFRP